MLPMLDFRARADSNQAAPATRAALPRVRLFGSSALAPPQNRLKSHLPLRLSTESATTRIFAPDSI